MRDEDERDAELALQVLELDLDLLAELLVEGPERLVEQQHLGLEGERPGERDPLPLAAGELVRLALLEARELDAAPSASATRARLRPARPSLR